MAGLLQDLVAGRALVDQRRARRPGPAPKTMSTCSNSIGGVHLLASDADAGVHAVEDDGEHDDGEAGLEARARC